MKRKSTTVLRVILIAQTVLFLLGFVFVFEVYLDFFAVTLFIQYVISLAIYIGGRHLILQMFYASMAYIIIMPFIFQSSDKKYLNLIQGVVQQMEMKTFLIFSTVGVLLPILYRMFSKNKPNFGNFKYLEEKKTKNSRIVVSHDYVDYIGIVIFFIVYGILYFVFDFSWMLDQRNESLKSELSSFEIMVSYIIKSMPSFVSFHSIFRSFQTRRSFNLSIIIICYLLLFVFVNPVNTPRIISLACWILPLLPLAIRYSAIGPALIAFPVFSAILLPITSGMRRGLENIRLEDTLDAYDTSEFSAMLLFNDAIRTMPDSALSYGNHIFSAIFILVPRSIWPDKNTGTGIEVAEQMGYVFTNVGMPPIFDFYLDFGLVGILIFCVFLAWIMSKLQGLLGKSNGNIFYLSLPCIFFISMPIFLRGDFSSAAVTIYALSISSALIYTISLPFRGPLRSKRPPRQALVA